MDSSNAPDGLAPNAVMPQTARSAFLSEKRGLDASFSAARGAPHDPNPPEDQRDQKQFADWANDWDLEDKELSERGSPPKYGDHEDDQEIPDEEIPRYQKEAQTAPSFARPKRSPVSAAIAATERQDLAPTDIRRPGTREALERRFKSWLMKRNRTTQALSIGSRSPQNEMPAAEDPLRAVPARATAVSEKTGIPSSADEKVQPPRASAKRSSWLELSPEILASIEKYNTPSEGPMRGLEALGTPTLGQKNLILSLENEANPVKLLQGTSQRRIQIIEARRQYAKQVEQTGPEALEGYIQTLHDRINEKKSEGNFIDKFETEKKFNEFLKDHPKFDKLLTRLEDFLQERQDNKIWKKVQSEAKARRISEKQNPAAEDPVRKTPIQATAVSEKTGTPYPADKKVESSKASAASLKAATEKRGDPPSYQQATGFRPDPGKPRGQQLREYQKQSGLTPLQTPANQSIITR